MSFKNLILGLALMASGTTFAQESQNIMDDFDPTSPDAEIFMEEVRQVYEEETGLSVMPLNLKSNTSGCYQRTCKVFIEIVKAEQKAYLFEDGVLKYEWMVSTGVDGHRTPDFDQRPTGPIYIKHDSSSYPSRNGGWRGMGNMPYAVMIKGVYGIHGTAAISKLGKRDSHGCIRLHPNNAKIFNSMVTKAGLKNSWVLVH